MQNQQFLEELQRLNQLRQQQQQDLLQAQLQLPQSLTGAVAAKYPLSSALLGSLASLGGAPAVPVAAPAPAANITNDALLLSKVQQQLQTGGALQQLAALGATPGPAPAIAPAPGLVLGNTLSATLANALTGSTQATNDPAMTNEEILSKLAATGLLGANIPNLLNHTQPAAAPPPPPPQPAPAPAGVSLPSLLSSLAANLDRKREATPTPNIAMAPIPPASKKQKVTPSPSPAASIDVLASAAELQTRQRSMVIVADRTLGNCFPLPPAADKNNSNKPRSGIMGMPKLTSFRKAWDSVKTKEMRKEIFLRKLHSGKMIQPRLSSKRSGVGNHDSV